MTMYSGQTMAAPQQGSTSPRAYIEAIFAPLEVGKNPSDMVLAVINAHYGATGLTLLDKERIYEAWMKKLSIIKLSEAIRVDIRNGGYIIKGNTPIKYPMDECRNRLIMSGCNHVLMISL